MSRELINLNGLRQDGRSANMLRRVTTIPGSRALRKADGVVELEQGLTKVIVTVRGPREPRERSKALVDRAFITCEFAVSPFATFERKSQSKHDRRLREAALLVKQTMEAAVLLHLYPRSEIAIAIQVLQRDGDVLCPAINATSLALTAAGIAMRDLVLACSVGFGKGTVLLDVNREEARDCTAVMNIATMAHSGKIVLLQLDGKLPEEWLETVMEAGRKGCEALHANLKKTIPALSIAQPMVAGAALDSE